MVTFLYTDPPHHTHPIDRSLGGLGEHRLWGAEGARTCESDESPGVARAGHDLQTGTRLLLEFSSRTRYPSSFPGSLSIPSRMRPVAQLPGHVVRAHLLAVSFYNIQHIAHPPEAPPLPVSELPSHWPSVLCPFYWARCLRCRNVNQWKQTRNSSLSQWGEGANSKRPGGASEPQLSRWGASRGRPEAAEAAGRDWKSVRPRVTS